MEWFWWEDGKIRQGEAIEEAAKREVLEEVGVEVMDLEKVGILEFESKNNPEIIEVHIFKVRDFKGIPLESDEMKPQWFDVNEIPFDKMWPADKFWMPLLLDGKKFKGKFFYDEQDNFLKKELTEVEKLTEKVYPPEFKIK